jgi:hypothetical protein
MKTGKAQGFFWLVADFEIVKLPEMIIQYHEGQILHLATFDSGPLLPTEEEVHQGWYTENEIMISPQLTKELHIPHEQYDEWYISRNILKFPKNLERFVNYGGFTLEPAEEGMKYFQAQFWDQLISINPATFVAIGDNDIVVSKEKQLIDEITKFA